MRACASRLPVGTCLERSLTLWWMLRRQGIPSEIHFGGRLEDDVLEAHAWLEVDGVALTDVDEPRDSFRELRTGPHRS